jgi:hypothetical protein
MARKQVWAEITPTGDKFNRMVSILTRQRKFRRPFANFGRRIKLPNWIFLVRFLFWRMLIPAMKNLKAGFAIAVLIVCVMTFWVIQHKAQTKSGGENQSLQQQTTQLPTQGQYEWHQTNTFNAAKLIELGMIMFASDNNNRFPTNFSQISNLTEGMTNQTSGIGTEAFEFVNTGCFFNNQNANKIILREQIPFRTADGKWARTYGFGDGHVEVQTSEDGNFDAFEQQHMVSPPPNQ